MPSPELGSKRAESNGRRLGLKLLDRPSRARAAVWLREFQAGCDPPRGGSRTLARAGATVSA